MNCLEKALECVWELAQDLPRRSIGTPPGPGHGRQDSGQRKAQTARAVPPSAKQDEVGRRHAEEKDRLPRRESHFGGGVKCGNCLHPLQHLSMAARQRAELSSPQETRDSQTKARNLQGPSHAEPLNLRRHRMTPCHPDAPARRIMSYQLTATKKPGRLQRRRDTSQWPYLCDVRDDDARRPCQLQGVPLSGIRLFTVGESLDERLLRRRLVQIRRGLRQGRRRRWRWR